MTGNPPHAVNSSVSHICFVAVMWLRDRIMLSSRDVAQVPTSIRLSACDVSERITTTCVGRCCSYVAAIDNVVNCIAGAMLIVQL